MFKDSEILKVLTEIDKKLANILTMLKSTKIKSVVKKGDK